MPPESAFPPELIAPCGLIVVSVGHISGRTKNALDVEVVPKTNRKVASNVKSRTVKNSRRE